MIQSHNSAPEGSVKTLPTYSSSDFPCDAAILCRNTAPLITFAYGLINRSIPCRVLGREIGKGLTTLIAKLSAKSIDDLQDRLAIYQTRETSKLFAKGEDSAASAIEDKCQCIRVFIENLTESSRTINTLCLNIEKLFSDDGSAKGLLTLATIHKSKGLEWPTVFILDRDLLPSKYARLPWQKLQEQNLFYVAITRAKLHLRYITSGSWQRSGASQQSQNANRPSANVQAALFED